MDTATATSAPADPPHRRAPPERRVDVRAALRTRDFRLLFSAYAISTIGSEVTVLALPLAAALLLGATPLQMGLLTAAGTAPYIGFALVVGAWVDRLRRRRPLMIAADLVAAVALLTVPLAWAMDLLTVPQLIAVELVVGVARVVFRPTFISHLPDVVPDQAMTEASSRLKAAEAVAMLAGPTLGGSLMQLLTAPVAVLARRVVVPDLSRPGRPGAGAGAGRLRAAAAPPARGGDRRRHRTAVARPPAARDRRCRGQPQLLRPDGLRAARGLPDPGPRLQPADDRGGHGGRRVRARWSVRSWPPGSPTGSAAAGRSCSGRPSSRSG